MTATDLDKETFCTLVLAQQEPLFRAARAILRNDQDAEDAVQEAICSAFASRSQLQDTEKFRAWLTRILVNRCYDICRKRRPTVDLADVQDYLPAAEESHAERMTVWQAVLSLNEDLRAPIALFYYDGFSIKEISRILDISQPAVKTRLSRGWERLRRLLGEK